MGFGSLWHWIIVLVIVLVLFGRGRISEMMGDFGKGISSFKKGLNETEDTVNKAVRLDPPAAPAETPAAQPAPADKTDTTGA
ncbi:MAG: twin-arginine translocase TatA/TatE family subunit [Erythrobacteraceae bacterium]|jgi:sec-independent protein translocase protein TatA